CAARGASTRLPNRRALPISSACASDSRNASEANIAASSCVSVGSCTGKPPLKLARRSRAKEEIKDGSVEGARCLEVRQVAGVGQAHIARAGDLFGPPIPH